MVEYKLEVIVLPVADVERSKEFYPGRRSYGSFVSFTDPDGNGFLLPEISERFPGR